MSALFSLFPADLSADVGEELNMSEPSTSSGPITSGPPSDVPAVNAPDVSGNRGITVMQTSNEVGCRKWDKKHFCFYCDVPQAKLPRHLQSCHKEEREVVELASQTNASARKRLLLQLRNLGNHRHNS